MGYTATNVNKPKTTGLDEILQKGQHSQIKIMNKVKLIVMIVYCASIGVMPWPPLTKNNKPLNTTTEAKIVINVNNKPLIGAGYLLTK